MLLGVAVLAACGPQSASRSKPVTNSKPPVASTQENTQENTGTQRTGAASDGTAVIVKTMPKSAVGAETTQTGDANNSDVGSVDLADTSNDSAINSDSNNAAGDAPQASESGESSGDGEATTQDVISSIIWEIQASQDQRKPVEEPKIPEGQDPSLAKDALEAAFALLAKKSQPELPDEEFELPEKAADIRRIALLVPLSGEHKALGEELRKGAELALFSLASKEIELLVIDTVAGPQGGPAARLAAEAKADIIIGPLFTEAAIPARNVAKSNNIPMISLSNNVDIGRSGSWILGYVPEQQLDVALAHSVSLGHKKFAVLAQDTPFGQRLTDHAQSRLQQFGIQPEDVRVLGKDVLGDEERLKNAIKSFARYQPPKDDDPQPSEINPPFETVIFAGDAAFALRTAPVLAYYDVASDRVSYLGNSLWNQRQILNEPSLQGGVFATRPTMNDDGFNKKWSAVWQDRPGLLARLSFDAVAMVVVLLRNGETDLAASLVADSGFAGFSGAFRLLPDGNNVRAFELRQIANGITTVITPAPSKL